MNHDANTNNNSHTPIKEDKLKNKLMKSLTHFTKSKPTKHSRSFSGDYRNGINIKSTEEIHSYLDTPRTQFSETETCIDNANPRSSLGSSVSHLNNSTNTFGLSIPKLSFKRKSSLKSDRSDSIGSETSSQISGITKIEEEDMMKTLQTPRGKKTEPVWTPSLKATELHIDEVKIKASHLGLDFGSIETAREIHEHSILRIFSYLIVATGQNDNERMIEVAPFMKIPTHFQNVNYNNTHSKKPINFQTSSPSFSVENIKNIKEECVFFLQYEHELRSAIKIQSLFRSFLARKKVISWKKMYLNQKIKKRNKALSELFKFELKALAKLQIVKDFYYENLKESGLLESKHLTLIFGNFLSIYNFHKHILDFMKKCRADWPKGSDRIGAAFLFAMPFMNEYIKYIQNFHVSLDHLETLTLSKPKFQAFLSEIQQKVIIYDEHYSLKDLLSSPIYDFEEYEKFLSDIVNTTPETNPRLPEILRSQETVVTNTLKIDRTFSVSLNNIVVGRIQGKFGWKSESLVKVGRSLVGEYEIKKFEIFKTFQEKEEKESIKDVHFLVLFNDSFLVASKNEGKVHVLFDEYDQIQKTKKSIEIKTPNTRYEITSASEKDTKILEEQIQNAANSYRDQHRVFGIDFRIIVKREQSKDGIPNFVKQTAKTLLEPKYLHAEGIFRTSGAQDDIKNLIKVINESGGVTWGNYGPHTVAGVFKMWFRALPYPLIDYSFYQKIITQAKAPKEKRIEFLKSHLTEIDETNLNLIKFLCRFLFLVSQAASQNRMSLENLAICWAPNIFRPTVETPETALQSGSMADIFVDLVELLKDSFQIE